MIIKNILEKKLFVYGILLSLSFASADLYSKYYIFDLINNLQDQGLIEYPAIKITSFFNLVQVWNNGVSFGMFSSFANAKIFIIIMNLAISAILLIWLFRNTHQYLMIALAFVLGGAFGNLIDRIINDAVADFLDFHLFGYHWPAFNLADSFIFIGVVMLLLENFFIKKDEAKK